MRTSATLRQYKHPTNDSGRMWKGRKLDAGGTQVGRSADAGGKHEVIFIVFGSFVA